MSFCLAIALSIIGFAAAFHLHWAFGGQRGFSVSLPQRPDGTPVMSHRIGWWRPAAGAVAVALLLLGGMAVIVDRPVATAVPPTVPKTALLIAATAFLARVFTPTPWTGFFKTIRTTRWARFDTWLYSPLFLILGLALLGIALRD